MRAMARETDRELHYRAENAEPRRARRTTSEQRVNNACWRDGRSASGATSTRATPFQLLLPSSAPPRENAVAVAVHPVEQHRPLAIALGDRRPRVVLRSLTYDWTRPLRPAYVPMREIRGRRSDLAPAKTAHTTRIAAPTSDALSEGPLAMVLSFASVSAPATASIHCLTLR